MSMQAIMAANQSMARMQAMQSAQAQMQGSANILRIESKLDGGNAAKDADAATLEQQSGDLMGDLMGQLTDVNKTLKPEDDAKVEGPSKEEETANNPPKSDTVALSDAAVRHMSQGTPAKPAVLEAVTYDAGGSKIPSAPAKAAPTLEATV